MTVLGATRNRGGSMALTLAFVLAFAPAVAVPVAVSGGDKRRMISTIDEEVALLV